MSSKRVYSFLDTVAVFEDRAKEFRPIIMKNIVSICSVLQIYGLFKCVKNCDIKNIKDRLNKMKFYIAHRLSVVKGKGML
jgi:hypothetical protein